MSDKPNLVKLKQILLPNDKSAPAQHRHKCPICGNSFKEPNKLRSHIQGAHQLGEGYKCPHCALVFHWKRSFTRHVEKSCRVRRRELLKLKTEAAAVRVDEKIQTGVMTVDDLGEDTDEQ